MPAKRKPSSKENEEEPLKTLAERRELKRAFFERIGGGEQLQAIFRYIPDVHFFAKDREGRIMAGSGGLLTRLGLQCEDDIIGLTDLHLHPPRTAREIREDDERVMSTREPLVDRVEALFTTSHAKEWYVTTKLPLFDKDGEVIGIMGLVRPYLRNDRARPGAERLDPIIAYIQENHHRAILVDELAKIAHLSSRQLQRVFHDVFGMSTETFIVRTRVQAAGDDLLNTDKPLSEIAMEHGFCDQSAFSRRFAEHTGETPKKFRQRRIAHK